MTNIEKLAELTRNNKTEELEKFLNNISAVAWNCGANEDMDNIPEFSGWCDQPLDEDWF